MDRNDILQTGYGIQLLGDFERDARKLTTPELLGLIQFLKQGLSYLDRKIIHFPEFIAQLSQILLGLRFSDQLVKELEDLWPSQFYSIIKEITLRLESYVPGQKRITSELEAVAKWSPDVHTLTPEQFQENVRLLLHGRMSPTSSLRTLPKELMLQIIKDYAKVWSPTTSTSTTPASTRHRQFYKFSQEKPLPSVVHMARMPLNSSSASLRDNTWRSSVLISLDDNNVVNARFMTTPNSKLAKDLPPGNIHTFRQHETIKIEWNTEGSIVKPASYFNAGIPDAGLEITVPLEQATYYLAFNNSEVRDNWLNSSPLAQFNKKLLSLVEIPESALSQGYIVDYSLDQDRFYEGRPILIGYVSHHRLVKGPVYALRTQGSRQGMTVKDLNNLLVETRLCMTMDHPNVLKIFGTTLKTKYNVGDYLYDQWLICQTVYGPSGRDSPVTIYRAMKWGTNSYKSFKPFPVFLQVQMARSILVGLDYLHRFIAHRALGPKNIFIVFDPSSGNPKGGEVIIYNYEPDRFASTEITSDSNNIATLNSNFTAPEAYNYSSWNSTLGKTQHFTNIEKKGDIYSFGMILFFMATGQIPFYDMRAADVTRKLNIKPAPGKKFNPDAIPLLARVEFTNHPLVSIIEETFAYDPLLRPSAGELIRMLDAILEKQDNPEMVNALTPAPFSFADFAIGKQKTEQILKIPDYVQVPQPKPTHVPKQVLKAPPAFTRSVQSPQPAPPAPVPKPQAPAPQAPKQYIPTPYYSPRQSENMSVNRATYRQLTFPHQPASPVSRQTHPSKPKPTSRQQKTQRNPNQTRRKLSPKQLPPQQPLPPPQQPLSPPQQLAPPPQQPLPQPRPQRSGRLLPPPPSQQLPPQQLPPQQLPPPPERLLRLQRFLPSNPGLPPPPPEFQL